MKEPLSPGDRRIVVCCLGVMIVLLAINIGYWRSHTLPTQQITSEMKRLLDQQATPASGEPRT